MATKKTKVNNKRRRLSRRVEQRVKINRPQTSSATDKTSLNLGNLGLNLSRLNLRDNKSVTNLILGILILIVLGTLLFNYFAPKNPSQDLGPAQQTDNTQQAADVTKENLPGKYTVKEGDTLFLIAQKYYGDGYKYPQLAEENKLADANVLEVGQVLNIPKLDTAPASPAPEANAQNSNQGTGGATNQTIWGERITADSYTVQEGDWLSKIAGRAYGDIMAFDRIAKANNIQNPDLIEPGMVLKIPR